MFKICSKCKQELSLEEFYPSKNGKFERRGDCKACVALRVRKFNANPTGRSLRLEKKRNFYKNQENLKKKGEYDKARLQKPGVKEKRKLCNRSYQAKRKNNDINFRISKNLRSRLWMAIHNNQKKGSAITDLGCSIENLKIHLEALFKPGMNWNNYGKWHIDHKKPLTAFDLTKRSEVLEACHFSNLEPLWAVDNIKKGAKYG